MHGPVIELRRLHGTTVPLRAFDGPDGLCVVAGSPLPGWAEEGLRTGVVVVRLERPGPWRRASVRELDDPRAIAEVRRTAEALGGPESWTRWFGGSPRLLRLELDEGGTGRTESDRVREEFDALAPAYAAHSTDSRFRRHLRACALGILHRLFPRPARLIEFGPGTGAQTLPMLRAGHAVVALDPSPRMLDELLRNARTEGLAARLETRPGGLEAAGSLLAADPAGSFDGAYSFFGALNLVPDLAPLAAPLARAVRPGGRFVAGLLNRGAVLPSVELCLAGHLSLGRDRLGDRLRTDGYLHALTVYPRSPEDLARSLGEEFVLESAEAVSVLTPPFRSPRLEPIAARLAGPRLRALDRALARSGWGTRWADEVVASLVRRSAARGAARPF